MCGQTADVGIEEILVKLKGKAQAGKYEGRHFLWEQKIGEMVRQTKAES